MKNNLPRDAFGKKKLTLIDHFGVFLSLLAIKKYLPKNNNLELLDLGCGYHAALLHSLQKKIKTGVGIDFQIQPECINNLAKNNLIFIESPLETALDNFDIIKPNVITLISVLEHLNQPELILKKIHHLLQTHGLLLINVPTWRGKFFLEFSAFKLGTSPKEEMDDHKMYYDKRDLWPLLVKAGFKPSQIKLKYHKFGLNLMAIVHK